MNRRAVLGGLCAALLVATACASAGGGIRVSRAGGGESPTAGHPWTLKLAVRPASFHGVVRVSAAGPARILVRAAGGRGKYRARLVFPRPGRWRLTARAGASRSRLGSVRVLARAPLVLDQPTGIDVQPNGSLLVVEFGLRRLVRVLPASGRVVQVASLVKPWGVARAPSGSIFVSDQNNLRRIDPGHPPVTVASVDPAFEIGPVAVTPAGDVVYSTEYALYLLPGGKGLPRRLAAGTTLSGPHGIAVASDGALLVSDTGSNRILRVDGGKVAIFATLGSPRGIDVARDGTVYVASGDEHHIVRFSASGGRLGFVGPRFGDTYALSVATDGTVYAVDLGGTGIIRRIAPDGTASVVPGP